jgi:hypothetical protein
MSAGLSAPPAAAAHRSSPCFPHAPLIEFGNQIYRPVSDAVAEVADQKNGPVAVANRRRLGKLRTEKREPEVTLYC